MEKIRCFYFLCSAVSVYGLTGTKVKLRSVLNENCDEMAENPNRRFYSLVKESKWENKSRSE